MESGTECFTLLFITSIAFVTITELKRNVSRYDIECSGDTIPYACVILSNSENVVLMWFVTIPGETTLNVTYDKTSSRNSINHLGVNITTTLSKFVDEEYIESTLLLTVLDAPSINGTIVECRSTQLDGEITMVYVNKSGNNSQHSIVQVSGYVC